MNWIILALSAALFSAVWLLVRTDQARMEAEKSLAVAKAGREGARAAADRFEKLFLQHEKRAQELRDLAVELAFDQAEMLNQARQQERARAQEQVTRLHSQVQAMAERLASMKVKFAEQHPGMTFEEDEVAFDAMIHEPSYSAGLTAFINALESDEAKEMVEDYIIAQRDEGMIDAQILEKLERGDY